MGYDNFDIIFSQDKDKYEYQILSFIGAIV